MTTNLNSPLKQVRHVDLRRSDAERSPFCSWCPVCSKGILLVARNEFTMELSRYDRCTSCGQSFWYLDDRVHGERFYEPSVMA